MVNKKLEAGLETIEIKQTHNRIDPIRFKEEAIIKVKKENYIFNKKKFLYIPFNVSKDTHQKSLVLKILKGKSGEKSTDKVFYLRFWFNNRADMHWIDKYSQRFGVTECNKYLLNLVNTHTDIKTGFWIKDPNKTRKDEKRIIEKPDTMAPSGYTVNEVIEHYCGAEIPGEESERGFSKDRKDGYRTGRSCRVWFRYMAGYNQRQSLIEFDDDEQGDGIYTFKHNTHLRISKPTSWRDLFKKFPPGKGVLKDRHYYNRRRKQTYSIPASLNKSIYDSNLGKSLISELKPGEVELWLKGLSSMLVKKEYVKVFSSLWIFAKKKGWLGTDAARCPITLETVYVKKEKQKSDPYKDIAITDPAHFKVFWECSEELSKGFLFQAELHQFMILTALRKTEALKMKKEFINWDDLTLIIPKGVGKTRSKDELLPITPELEILLRNILNIGNRPGLEFYKMKDHPWLFGTRKWGAHRYFDKVFKQSSKARLGGDEKYIPVLRSLMRQKLNDPTLLYAPKILRKTYVTLSQQIHRGRSEITQQMSRHKDSNILNNNYNKPSLHTVRGYAESVSSTFSFIQKRLDADVA